MLLRFQKAVVRGNYDTGNQAFSMRLRFLTMRGFQHNAALLHAGRQVSMPSVSASWKSLISKVFSPDSIFVGTGLVGPTYHPPFHMCTPESTCCNEAMIVFRSTSPRTAPFFVPDEVLANHSSSFAKSLQQLPREAA